MYASNANFLAISPSCACSLAVAQAVHMYACLHKHSCLPSFISLLPCSTWQIRTCIDTARWLSQKWRATRTPSANLTVPALGHWRRYYVWYIVFLFEKFATIYISYPPRSSPTTATYPPLVHRGLWRTAELPKGVFSGRGRENWHDCPCDVNSSQCWSKCSYSNDCACAFCRCVYMCVCTLLNHKHTFYSFTPYVCVSMWVWLRECVGGGRTGEGGRERSLNYRWNTTIFVKYYYIREILLCLRYKWIIECDTQRFDMTHSYVRATQDLDRSLV